MFFKYDTVIDVKNVNEYTITDLAPGVFYYLAATAYSDPEVPGQESKFSVELQYFVPVIAPAKPVVLRIKVPPPYDLRIVDGEKSDPIKEIHEEK